MTNTTPNSTQLLPWVKVLLSREQIYNGRHISLRVKARIMLFRDDEIVQYVLETPCVDGIDPSVAPPEKMTWLYLEQCEALKRDLAAMASARIEYSTDP